MNEENEKNNDENFSGTITSDNSDLSVNHCSSDTNYKPHHPGHQFCCEFQRAILKFATDDSANIKDAYGNWFGRMVAFKYEVDILGKIFKEDNNNAGHNEDEFRQKLRERKIWIKEYRHYFRSVEPEDPTQITNTIKARVRIVTGGELILNGDYDVTYTVQNAGFEATKIEVVP